MKNKIAKLKIVVALSGGIDSSYTLYLLKKQNYDVCAIFMRNWDNVLNFAFSEKNYDCQQSKDFKDAEKISKFLNVKLYYIDFSNEYWNYVFKYLINEYKKGKTPNPDLLCNKFIKFGYLLEYVKNFFNIYYIATGHYSIIKQEKNKFKLYKAFDKKKDQSYFLSQLNQNQLKHIFFPLGKKYKKNIKTFVKKNNFPNFNKKESVGICFVNNKSKFKVFLKNYINEKKGKIIDIDSNKVLQNHDGVYYYTIGQRKGVVTVGGSKTPYYVVKKNIKKNIIYVSNKKFSKHLYSKSCKVENINWINKPKIKKNIFYCSAKVRYLNKDNLIKLKFDNKNNLKKVIFLNYTKSVTPGQFIVFYNNFECIGSAIIKKTFFK